MFEFPFGYEKIAPATWAYLSSLIMLAVFFKFNRFWSVRNLDLFLIILLAPGLIMVYHGEPTFKAELNYAIERVNQLEESGQGSESKETKNGDVDGRSPLTRELDKSPEYKESRLLTRSGYIWLFLIGTALLLRALFDPLFVRRPVLEPNLSIGGLTFLACAMLIFTVADVSNSDPSTEQLDGPRQAMRIVNRDTNDAAPDRYARRGPGLALFHLIPILPTYVNNERQVTVDGVDEQIQVEYEFVAKIMTVVFLFLMVVGIVWVGHRHFDDLHTGLGMATIYLMLPYTSQYAGHVMHILPAMLLVWAIASYRRPMVAGILVGLAASVSYYPIFLLPLWFSFYWFRGAGRFLTGVLGSIGIVIGSLIFLVDTPGEFFGQLQAMFGFWVPRMEKLEGIWMLGWDPWFRIPFMVAFLGLSISFVFWPGRKTLDVLIACSAAIMIAVQFWHGFGGGTVMAWYLPLLLMVFFRPNLKDFDAENEVAELRFGRRASAGDESSVSESSEDSTSGNGKELQNQQADADSNHLS